MAMIGFIMIAAAGFAEVMRTGLDRNTGRTALRIIG